MCANIHSQNGTAILAQELLSRKWENLKPAHPHQGWRQRRIFLRSHHRTFQMHSRMESLNWAHHWNSCWWWSQSPTSSNTHYCRRTMSQWRTWLTAGTQPRWLVNKDQENLDLKQITMASQPPVLALRQWNYSRLWGPLKRWSRHTHRCWPLRDQDLLGHFPWPKSCVNAPNLRRNFQPNGASQNHNTGTRGVMLSCVASTSFAAKARLVSFTPSTSSVPFRKKGRDPSRPVRRSQWMAGRRKKRRKNGQHQPHGASWSDCTWYSGTPCWCVWLPSPSFLNSTWRRKTLTLSMTGSMDLSWGAVGLPPRSRHCSWQSAMHGERCMSRCMVACISKKPLRRSKTTACSGWEKSMKESSPKGQKANQRKAKTRRAHGGTPSANRSGRRKERAMETKVAKEKEKGSQNPQTGRRTGLSRIQRGFPFAEIISSRRPAKASVDVLTIVQWWTLKAGSAMRDPRSTSQRIALTRLEGIGRLPMALWSILETKREATSSRMTLVQQAHKHPPRFGAENHQELGVPQIAQGL